MNAPLTSLANVKSWLGLTNTTDDALLTRMIQMGSGYVRNWINRDITIESYTDKLDGTNSKKLILPNYPIISISSLKIDGNEIPEKINYLANGYYFHDYFIDLDGYYFTYGKNNVEVSYTAGFQTMEVSTIPTTGTSANKVTVKLFWVNNVQVLINLVSLTEVTGTPASGEYTAVNGLYTFNSAQSGQQVSIVYGFVPGDIEQAVIDLVGRKYRERDRIGMVSKAMAGETTAFSQSDMSEDTKKMLQQYRKVFPI